MCTAKALVPRYRERSPNGIATSAGGRRQPFGAAEILAGSPSGGRSVGSGFLRTGVGGPEVDGPSSVVVALLGTPGGPEPYPAEVLVEDVLALRPVPPVRLLKVFCGEPEEADPRAMFSPAAQCL